MQTRRVGNTTYHKGFSQDTLGRTRWNSRGVNGSVGTTRGFVNAVNNWTAATVERSEEAFKISCVDLVIELNETAPIDTGFLRSSLTAGINGQVPAGPNAEYQSNANDQRLLGVIGQLKLGDKLTLVYNATYARRLELGFTGVDSIGRYFNQPGRFWIARAGAKWRSIVRAAATRLRG